jgi:DNA polymerase
MDRLATLRLLIEWGADEALEVMPRDRLQALVPIGLKIAGAPPAPRRVPSGGSAERAAAAATAAPGFAALRAAITAFDGCSLRDTATNLVFAEGDPAAPALLIGEAPAADDDRIGRPFAGEGGAYLDRMLASIGVDRSQLLLTPLIPWRPPGGRPPSGRELDIWIPFLHRLIALSSARVLVLLGTGPAHVLLSRTPARKRKGLVALTIPGVDRQLDALPMSSPAAILCDPALRRQAWTDLRLLRRSFDQLAIKS